MTDNEITREKTFSEKLPYFKERIKEVFDHYSNPDGGEDPLYINVLRDSYRIVRKAEEEINHQQEEIERLHDEVSKTRRKALLEASSKFAGHSDYHGDTILCKLICMAEGKEVKIAKPLDKSEIKSEAVKEFADKAKEKMRDFAKVDFQGDAYCLISESFFDNLVKEMVGEKNDRQDKG